MAIIIWGAGVAGLWCLNRLMQAGHDVYLVEDRSKPSQTIFAQGIIHSGMKYGQQAPEAQALRDMPSRWNSCLKGCGEIDLRAVPILGKLEPWDEIVVNVEVLLEVLREPYHNRILREPPVGNYVAIWAAGSGNAHLVPIQRRPLHQVIARWPDRRPVYRHELDEYGTPKLTITTHYPDKRGCVWNLGGTLAEEGIALKSFEQIERAKQQINLEGAECESFLVDRIEPWNVNGEPQRLAFVEMVSGSLVVFPGKLAFAPLVGDRVIECLNSLGSL